MHSQPLSLARPHPPAIRQPPSASQALKTAKHKKQPGLHLNVLFIIIGLHASKNMVARLQLWHGGGSCMATTVAMASATPILLDDELDISNVGFLKGGLGQMKIDMCVLLNDAMVASATSFDGLLQRFQIELWRNWKSICP